jgi:hypothetical protein
MTIAGIQATTEDSERGGFLDSLKYTDVSEVRTASIIRKVEADGGPDNGGSTNLNDTARRFSPQSCNF